MRGDYHVPDGPFGRGYTVPASTFAQWGEQARQIAAETSARAADLLEAERRRKAELAEAAEALAWCRANGNPHVERSAA